MAQASMLRVGKHRGKRFEEVADTDRTYCTWVLKANPVPQWFQRFASYLRKTHGGIMGVGKHKGRFFDEIIAGDPGYADWAKNLVDPSETLTDFISYVNTSANDAEEPPPKRQCTGSVVCIICCDRGIDSAFVPCGHAVACMACGSKFSDAECPICKQSVCLVLKTYGV